ncbi:DNA ligase D [Xenophilus sp. Marseille-Q4582]|uniref:DNA ligase D n=1 Tax=Xenophilus sp. Marseille-Q4582 TaxID=2866600 RepID=UPI001CE476F3|nr:DNA ligase D [Xenophilus sp. Marseille-Q4582]
MPDSLALYRKKRNFALTPEPAEGGEPGQGALQYVIQKHWASRLHYDLRLEIDGTMKSWAVPKGPSFDPADKRMAVQVEDHPISYNRFEGQIPPGQYGAGKVIIWDRGWWVPVGDAAEGWRQGKLKFELHGHKLRGHWTLVRMHGRGDEKQPPWLLIKEQDGLERPAADFSVVDEMPDSVAQLPPVAAPSRPRQARASVQEAARHQRQAGKAPLPAAFSPQLATLVDGPPRDVSEWLWELKFDGYRLLARVDDGRVQLFTRNGNDWTARMPVLAEAVAQLPLRSGWLDGEVLMLDAQGTPDFQALQNAFDGASTKDLVYYFFDMPYADGRDLRALPVVERRELLRAVVAGSPTDRVRFSEAFEARPGDLVASACKLGFEGVIGKRKSAPYASRRNADWIKLKCSHRQEFVIGGFTDPQGSRTGIGSLLLGVHAPDGSLQYAGNVGTGFNQRTLAELRGKLDALATDRSPFAHPRSIGRKAHWVEPRLLAEVSFAEWTKENRIRHSVFHGLRDDKPARAIVQEKPVHLNTAAPTDAATDEGAAELPSTLRVSNARRVIDPSTGLTKIDLVRYYAKVAPLLMPHLKARPVALVRAPEGVKGELFFQKHLDTGAMDGVLQLDPALYAGHPPLLEVAQPEGLLAAAQMNMVELHTWNARKDRIHRPDRMTFDLDPGEGVAWEQVQEAAHLVQVMLQELGLPAFLKTSGGKGLHVVVPIKRLHDWDTVKGFSQAVVQHLARTIPQRFVAKSGPKNRIGKIFVDYLRNGWGATTVSAWSARARPGMGISVPVAWKELGELRSGAHWTVQSVDQRLRQGNAPWEGYDKAAVSLGTAMKRLGYGGPARGSGA